MYTSHPSVSIEDLARLAGETCVYRGTSQCAKPSALSTTNQRETSTSTLQKILTLFKRR